jgi:hypothetical protein
MSGKLPRARGSLLRFRSCDSRTDGVVVRATCLSSGGGLLTFVGCSVSTDPALGARRAPYYETARSRSLLRRGQSTKVRCWCWCDHDAGFHAGYTLEGRRKGSATVARSAVDQTGLSEVFLFAEVATREAGQGESDADQPYKALHQTILHEMPESANKEACRINGHDGLIIHDLRLTVFWDVVTDRTTG